MKGEVVPNGHFIDNALRRNGKELDELPKWRWLRRLHVVRERCGILETFRIAVVKRDGFGSANEWAPPAVFSDGPDDDA